jgi:gluconokinase
MLSTDHPTSVYAHRHPLYPISANASYTINGFTAHPPHIEHIWIITGPAGCGKTTVAQYLAKELQLPYVEGDDWHSASNKEKMAKNIPLTDADRWDWLITLREEAIKRLQSSNSVIVTCSALKHKYRDVIRVANYEHPTVQIHFIYLRVDEHTLQQRVAARVGHYMKEGMVHSQMVALEEPDEEWDVLAVDVRKDKEEVQRKALEVVKRKLAEYPEAEP